MVALDLFTAPRGMSRGGKRDAAPQVFLKLLVHVARFSPCGKISVCPGMEVPKRRSTAQRQASQKMHRTGNKS